jgi:hypothetical protein
MILTLSWPGGRRCYHLDPSIRTESSSNGRSLKIPSECRDVGGVVAHWLGASCICDERLVVAIVELVGVASRQWVLYAATYNKIYLRKSYQILHAFKADLQLTTSLSTIYYVKFPIASNPILKDHTIRRERYERIQ